MVLGRSVGRRRAKHLASLGAAIAVAFTAAALSAAPAHAQAPTLAGEQFAAPSPNVELIATCDPDGTSMVSFSAFGPALGPYPGTFTETGSATIGPQVGASIEPFLLFGAFSSGPVLSFDVQFTIDSPTGQVTGTKQLDLLVGGQGLCTEFENRDLPGLANATGSAVFLGALLSYDAEIEDTATQTTTSVAGTASAEIHSAHAEAPNDQGGTTGVSDNLFAEAFLTSDVVAGTPGKVTGGGQILRTSNSSDKVSFGLTAQQQIGGLPKGNCTVIDHVTKQQFKCVDVTKLVVTPTHATITGNARIVRPDGGQEMTTYRIDVDDLDEPGIGMDTFKFQTDSGYTATGTLTSGNIQIHKLA